VGEVFLCELGIGAAFGLGVKNGSRVFLKAHKLDRFAGFLEAVVRVQAHLYARGFPCPGPLAGPRPFGPGLATVEEFLDGGRACRRS
jgi:hypothetical protein